MDNHAQQLRSINWIDRFLLWIAYVDPELSRRMPRFDSEQPRGLALVAMLVFAYQALLLALVSHRIFATSGEVRIDLILASLFIATFVLILDRQLFYGPGWYAAGHAEIARAGLDLRGGPLGQAKTVFLLVIRIGLSAAMSVLLGLVFSIIIFAKDVDRRVERNYHTANAVLIADETRIVDESIKRAADAEAAQQARVTALSSQVSAVRQKEIDPTGNDSQAAEAQKELSDLLAQEQAAQADLKQAEDLASRERGGFSGENLSGRPGTGPRYAGAVEMAKNARAHANELASEVAKARARLDALHARLSGASATAEQRAKDDLPGLTNDLAAEDAKLAGLKTAHDDLVSGREQAIRKAIEQSPNYVAIENGFLAQLTALDEIAHENPKIGWVILLVEFVSAGFELAGVLAKVLASMPSYYGTALVKDSVMSASRTVDEIMREFGKQTPTDDGDDDPPRPPANDNKQPPPVNDNDEARTNGLGGIFGLTAGQPAKRGRGRPRKNPRPEDLN